MLRLDLGYKDGVVNFPVDAAESFIEGLIVADEPDTIYWNIHIKCQKVLVPHHPDVKEYYPNHIGFDQDCTLQLEDLTFPLADWRDLAGQDLAVSFASEEVHPILPDNPGNFYFDETHHVPNGNQLRFGNREGFRFAIEWECMVHAYAEDNGYPIAVKTHLPLRQFRVWFRQPGAVSLELARQSILRFAQPDDICESFQRTQQTVIVPVSSQVA